VTTIGSIILKADPVKRREYYARTLVPMGSPGPCEMYFSDYRPSYQSEGWFHSASFRVHARENVLKELYANGLGRMVEVWGYGLKQHFEGRVVEVVFNLPPDQFTKTLDQIGNRTWMRADVDGDGTVDRSTELQNTDSQGKYGTTDLVISGGQIQGLTVADQAVQAFLDLKAFPKPAADLGGGRGQAYIELFCRGWINTLGNRVWNQTADTGTQAMSAEIRDIIGTPAVPAHPYLPEATLLPGMIAWWPLDEHSGTSVHSEISGGVGGTLGAGAAAPTLAAAGIGDGRSAMSFDGGDYVDVYSAALAAAFNGAKGSLLIWARITDAAVWADATSREMVYLAVDGNNDINIRKDANANTVEFIYRAGGTAEVVDDTSLAASTDWFLAAMTWDKSADQVKCYLNAAQVGATQTGLGTWAGTLASTLSLLGARSTVPANPHKGLLQHPIVFAGRVLTEAEIAAIYAGGDGVVAAVAASGVGEYIASQHRAPNTTSVTKELDADRKALDIINNMTSLGDADNNRYLLQGRGRTPTSVKGRRGVFKQAAPVVVPPSI
jgi:hypothetical protein